MPPPLPRSGLLNLPVRNVAQITALSSRAISTTPCLSSNQKIPPEAPSWLVVPQPPQSEERPKQVHRGHLPVPRKIFHSAEDAAYKLDTQYLQRTMPKAARPANSAKAAKGSKPKTELEADITSWNARISEQRRENLSQGLQRLWERHGRRTTHEKQQRKRVADRIAARTAKPEGEDEIFTRSTVMMHTLGTTEVPLDPLRLERAAESQERTAKLHEAQSTARKDALQQLYVNAKNFIVDEKELDETVARLFADDYWEKQNKTAAADNAWAAWGPPLGMAELIQDATGVPSAMGMVGIRSGSSKTTKRQQLVSEELTGGKMNI